MKRGVRHGCMLAMYVFLIVGEVIDHLMKDIHEVVLPVRNTLHFIVCI